MNSIEKKKLLNSTLFPILLVTILIAVKVVEMEWGANFTDWGVLPRDLKGLRGIVFSVFIHGDWKHLINNSIPLFILGTALFYFYKEVAIRVSLLSLLLSSFYTWISARYSYDIGASGLVYALFGFLLISGFLRKHVQLIGLSFLVAFLYGSLVWGILPLDKHVSWEGHFWGLAVGIVLAFFYKRKGLQRKVYVWEEEVPEEEEERYWEVENTAENDKNIEVVYHFKSKEEKED